MYFSSLRAIAVRPKILLSLIFHIDQEHILATQFYLSLSLLSPFSPPHSPGGRREAAPAEHPCLSSSGTLPPQAAPPTLSPWAKATPLSPFASGDDGGGGRDAMIYEQGGRRRWRRRRMRHRGGEGRRRGEVVAAISSRGGGGHLPSPRRRSLLSLLCLSLSSPAATAISSGRGGGHIPSPAGGLSPPPVPLPLSPAEAAAISSDESSRASRGRGEREGGGSRSHRYAAAPLPVDGISPLRGSSTLPSSSPVVTAVAYGAGGGDESHDGAAPLSLLPPVPLPCNARSSLHSNEFLTRNPCPILAPRSSLGHG